MSNRLRPSNQLQRLRRLRRRHLNRRNSAQRPNRPQTNTSSSLPAHLSRARFSRAQITRWMMAPVLLALILIGGLRMMRQRLDVENVVRRSVLPGTGKSSSAARLKSDASKAITFRA
jgi:hypothetical protein